VHGCVAGLVDEQQKVRTITALALAALAEAATPYGIESFDSVLKPLWKGIRMHRGKGLAAFLKVSCCRVLTCLRFPTFASCTDDCHLVTVGSWQKLYESRCFFAAPT